MGALEIIPIVVHDGDGCEVRVSDAARAELARLIEAGETYIYTPIGEPLFYNIWFERPANAPAWTPAGVRVPLADWARAYEASQRGGTGGTAA